MCGVGTGSTTAPWSLPARGQNDPAVADEALPPAAVEELVELGPRYLAHSAGGFDDEGATIVIEPKDVADRVLARA